MKTKPFTGHWLRTGTALALVCLATGSARAEIRYVATNGHYVSPYTNWNDAATNLINALAVSAHGDTIIVSNGVYHPGNTIGIGKNIIITSLYGAAQTIFDGDGNAVRGFQQASAATSTIYGVTVSNYLANGFNCENVNSVLTLVNCVSTCNRANDGAGIRIYSGNLTASNCIIRGNTTWGSGYIGGGINFLWTYANTGTLVNCEISENVSAGYGGGVMAGEVITVRNCTIANNTSASYGGGIACVDAGTRLFNCRIISNSTRTAAGGGIYRVSQIYNSLIAFNSATSNVAGGANQSTLINCTVVSNLANRGGGTHECRALNSIVYFNVAKEPGYTTYSNYLYDAASGWSNCCTGPALGTDCVAADPKMVNMPADCHLLKGSPCINTGMFQDWMTGAVDLDGRPRIRLGAVDIGAYEYFPKGSLIQFQ